MSAEMVRRAAEACENLQAQKGGRREWFSWVPVYLRRVAKENDRLRRALYEAITSPSDDPADFGVTLDHKSGMADLTTPARLSEADATQVARSPETGGGQ